MTIRIDGTNTTANPGITGGDADTGLQFGTDEVKIVTGGSDRVTVDSSGNVGIGTTSPSSNLHIVPSTDDYFTSGLKVVRSTVTTAQYGLFNYSNGKLNIIATDTVLSSPDITFGTSTDGSTRSERARIDSSGRLLVGTSTASGNPKVDIVGNSASATGEGVLQVRRGSDGSATNNTLGVINFGDTISGGNARAQIVASADAAGGVGDLPARLVFSTTADGASSPTERMRIEANGTISTTAGSAPNSSTFGTALGRASNPGLIESVRDGTTTTVVCNFGGPLGNVLIKCDGDLENTNNRYTGISDIKLKENIVDATSQWADIKNLRVRNYNFKAETGFSTHTQIGLVAQEVESVSPGLVGETLNEDTGELTKNVAYSVLYMKAVKALQEAMERIEQLESSNADLLARVTALEAP